VSSQETPEATRAGWPDTQTQPQLPKLLKRYAWKGAIKGPRPQPYKMTQTGVIAPRSPAACSSPTVLNRSVVSAETVVLRNASSLPVREIS